MKKRNDVKFKYIEPVGQKEANEMRQKKYDLEQNLTDLRVEIAALVKQHIRGKNKEKREVRDQIKMLKEYLAHGGKPVEKPATMLIDESRGKVYCEVAGERVRFFHKGYWVIERDMADHEYEINEFFDHETDFNQPELDAPAPESIRVKCLQCDAQFDTRKDIHGKPVNRICKPCKKKSGTIL